LYFKKIPNSGFKNEKNYPKKKKEKNIVSNHISPQIGLPLQIKIVFQMLHKYQVSLVEPKVNMGFKNIYILRAWDFWKVSKKQKWNLKHNESEHLINYA
jgi:hypothetical protein